MTCVQGATNDPQSASGLQCEPQRRVSYAMIPAKTSHSEEPLHAPALRQLPPR
jgi:hypothetical protein